jgi:hypothetical protein
MKEERRACTRSTRSSKDRRTPNCIRHLAHRFWRGVSYEMCADSMLGLHVSGVWGCSGGVLCDIVKATYFASGWSEHKCTGLALVERLRTHG